MKKMNVLNLEAKSISLKELQSVSPEVSEKLKEIVKKIITDFKERQAPYKRTKEEKELMNHEFLSNITFEKIIYPKNQPVFVSTAKDGDFEYFYRLSVLENSAINGEIKTKTILSDIFSVYHFEKLDKEKESYHFLLEKTVHDTVEFHKIIVVQY